MVITNVKNLTICIIRFLMFHKSKSPLLSSKVSYKTPRPSLSQAKIWAYMYCESKSLLETNRQSFKLLVWKETTFLFKVFPKDKSPFTKML